MAEQETALQQAQTLQDAHLEAQRGLQRQQLAMVCRRREWQIEILDGGLILEQIAAALGKKQSVELCLSK